jgi:hypothetical protein
MAITPSASTCGVWLSVPTQVSGRPRRRHLDHRRHLLQVDLVHDAVARRDHVHVLERLLGPVDEVEAVFVAAVFDGAVLRERLGSKPPHSTASEWSTISCTGTTGLTWPGRRPVGDGVAQAGQVHQRGLAQDVVADHAGREPREVEVALALDQLPSDRSAWRVAAAHEVLGQHARGVGQRVIGAGEMASTAARASK